jgi:hypothetical protein
MELTRSQAVELLTEYVAVVRSRPARVGAAVDAGLTKSEIARLLEIGRDTVYRDLETLETMTKL